MKIKLTFKISYTADLLDKLQLQIFLLTLKIPFFQIHQAIATPPEHLSK